MRTSAIEGLGRIFEKKVQKIGKQAWHAAIRAAEEGCRFQKELFPFRSNLVRTKVDKKGENKPRSLEQLMNVKQVIIGLAKSMRAPGHPLREFTFTALCIVHRPDYDRDPRSYSWRGWSIARPTRLLSMARPVPHKF